MQETFTDISLSWKPSGLSRESTSLFLEASQSVLTVYHEGGKIILRKCITFRIIFSEYHNVQSHGQKLAGYLDGLCFLSNARRD